jgi:anti-sigma B factor antagonist
LVGELDIAAGAEMREALSDACSATADLLVIDVSGLTFMDASGLNLLVGAHNRRLEEGRRGLVVQGAAGIVRRVFEITQLTSLIEDPSPSTMDPAGQLSVLGGRELDQVRRSARLSVKDLYVDYFALGGTAELGEVAAHVNGASVPLNLHQQDVMVHALNERLVDLGQDRLLAYASDGR